MAPFRTHDRRGAHGARRDASATVETDSFDTVDIFDARAGRRAVSLLVLSILLPGSAQMLAGNRAVGRIVLRTWLGLLAVMMILGIIAWVSLSTVIGLVSAPWFLRLAQWFLTVWAIVWGLVILDAWRLGRPVSQPARSRRRFAMVTVMIMLLPASVAYAGASVGAGRSALAAVFDDGPALASSNGRYNILLLGGDGGADRVGTRPDTIQLASIDERTGRAVLFSFARDTGNVVFAEDSLMAELLPNGWTCGDDCLLNGLYTWAWDHQDQFPEDLDNPGLVATREAVEALSGLDVHYSLLVDLAGFEDVVNALGGLNIHVARRTPIGGIGSPISGWIEPGTQHLDGYHALWYARSRVGSTNYERMARQRCVLTAIVQQVDPVTVATRFRELASSTAGMFETDFPQSELGRFAELALKTRSQQIVSVSFVPPLMKPWDYDPEFVTAAVAEAIEESEALEDLEATRTPEPVDPSPPTGQPVVDSAQPSEEDPGAGLDRPGEDEHAWAEDAAAVCSVG